MLRLKKNSKKKQTMQFQPLPGTRSCNYRYVFAMMVIHLFVVTAIILVSLRGGRNGESTTACRSPQIIETKSLLEGSEINEINSAAAQLEFLTDQGSSLVNHTCCDEGGSGPAWWEFKAVPVTEFCKGRRSAGREFKYAAYTDIILAGRKLYLPASVNCSTIVTGSKPLRTRFNQGQRSTPEVPVMVLPEIATFDDFRPQVSCHETVLEPSFLFSFINWPQYGHFMFNGASLIWEAFDYGPLSNAGKNVRLYAYGDTMDGQKREIFQQKQPFFDLRGYEPLFSMFSNQPVRSLANLLKQSDSHSICFSYLVAGLSGDLDHYNFAAPLEKWREFAMSVRQHFQVSETPRINSNPANLEFNPGNLAFHPESYRNPVNPEFNLKNPRSPKSDPESAKFLERIAPEDALKGTPNIQSPIQPINYDILPDRPRLTIINRRSNRRILNVQKLQQTAMETGFFKTVQVSYLEEMDMASQIHLMALTDVLFGMDGTGLMNGLFMPEGGVVVHARPYGCSQALSGKGINFERLWVSNPGRVIRYESGDLKSTVFPTDIREVAEVAFNSSTPYGYRASFILKQDSIVDTVAFRCILDSAHKLLHGVSANWEEYRACSRTVFF